MHKKQKPVLLVLGNDRLSQTSDPGNCCKFNPGLFSKSLQVHCPSLYCDASMTCTNQSHRICFCCVHFPSKLQNDWTTTTLIVNTSPAPTHITLTVVNTSPGLTHITLGGASVLYEFLAAWESDTLYPAFSRADLHNRTPYACQRVWTDWWHQQIYL